MFRSVTSRPARAGLALALALAAGWAGSVGAAVDGSPHDLVVQGYIPVGEGSPRDKCTACHLPGIGGDPFPPGQDPPVSVTYFSRSGLVCWSCHDGTTIVNENVDASRSAFHPRSHPLRYDPAEQLRYDLGQKVLPVREGVLECITCHSQHDNAIRPFLRLPIGDLCRACHQLQESKGYGIDNLSGGHPVHETVEDDAGSTSPIDVQPSFKVPFPLPYPPSEGMLTTGIHWGRGGHLLAGGEGTVECFTCHAMHGTETKPPRDGLLAKDPVRVTADEFCEGCHRGTRGDGQGSDYRPNPGGTVTGRTYHPADDDISNGKDIYPAIRDRQTFPLGSGAAKAILCTTCHVPHGGIPKTAALRKPVTTPTFCEECHLDDDREFHHPVGPYSGGRACTPPPVDYLAQGAPPGLYCSACHVAHNAGLGDKEEDFIPLLKERGTEADLCLTCHPEDNPTCREAYKGTVSHFLGDPTLPETYAEEAPPIRKTAWSTTRLLSRYGGENGKKVICLSCHGFRREPGAALEAPLRHFLLADAGDAVEWEEDLGTYLCTGCHGDNPGTGQDETAQKASHSHPQMAADVTKLVQEVLPPATATLNGKINCDSCHRAHGAKIEGGYYILEEVRGDNADPKAVHPQIDYSVLCHLCHSPDEY